MAALDTALAEALLNTPSEQAHELKHVSGRVMGEVVLEVINPAIHAFPQLNPDDAIWADVVKARAKARSGIGQ